LAVCKYRSLPERGGLLSESWSVSARFVAAGVVPVFAGFAAKGFIHAHEEELGVVLLAVGEGVLVQPAKPARESKQKAMRFQDLRT
jgi:hypothetical protein